MLKLKSDRCPVSAASVEDEAILPFGWLGPDASRLIAQRPMGRQELVSDCLFDYEAMILRGTLPCPPVRNEFGRPWWPRRPASCRCVAPTRRHSRPQFDIARLPRLQGALLGAFRTGCRA